MKLWHSVLLLGVFGQDDNTSNPCELFTLTCTDVKIRVDVDQACLEGDMISIATDFDQSIFITSMQADSETNLNTVFAEKPECKPQEEDSQLKFMEFNVEQCHQDEISPASTSTTTEDDQSYIEYTYYIKHERLIGGIPISNMSPVPIKCKIQKTIQVSKQTSVVNKEIEMKEESTNFDDQSVLTLKVETTAADPADFRVGQEALISLEVQTTPVNYNDEFLFSYKKCEAKAVDENDSADAAQSVVLIDEYCANDQLGQILIKDEDGANTGEFQSFKVPIFKFPNSDKVQFECTILVCHKDIQNCFPTDECADPQLWSKTTSRKRRSLDEEVGTITTSAIIQVRETDPKSAAPMMMANSFLCLLMSISCIFA